MLKIDNKEAVQGETNFPPGTSWVTTLEAVQEEMNFPPRKYRR